MDIKAFKEFQNMIEPYYNKVLLVIEKMLACFRGDKGYKIEQEIMLFSELMIYIINEKTKNPTEFSRHLASEIFKRSTKMEKTNATFH